MRPQNSRPSTPRFSCDRSTLRQSAWNRFTLLAVLGGILAGCAAGINETASLDSTAPGNVPQSGDMVAQSTAESGFAADDLADAELVADQRAGETRSLPQLIKTAELDLTVDSVDDTIDTITRLVQQQGGDLLGLQNYAPSNANAKHTASMELRVPQARLDDTISQLTELGVVNRQSLTAEDVSSQMVDFEARLKNLRKAEEVTLGIMERSGEIGEVLQVGQELQNIRASIEQIAGQLNYLKNQVSYSTIRLTLENAAPARPETATITARLSQTWASATRSVSNFTLVLVQLGIWLIVYIPYWLVLAGILFLVYRLGRRTRSSSSDS